MSKVSAQVAALEQQMAKHDPADYQGLTALGEQRQARQAELAEVEARWLELAEAVE